MSSTKSGTRKKGTSTSRSSGESGRLRIGDDWNAINIIALSQSNPLKAVAEFVENSIDAGARKITITRGRERGEAYLRIMDDGAGIPRDDDGRPNFKYVATHICDSIKRQLKSAGREGIQGEFGIGLLSFWTVGEELTLISPDTRGKLHAMRMRRGDPHYSVTPLRRLFPGPGTELTVKPLLSGIRHFSGEKLQWYLASELRDRLRQSGVDVRILDRQSKAEYRVEPRQFNGRLLPHLTQPETSKGDVYVELYMTSPSDSSRVSLYRGGTRVLADLAELDPLRKSPWTSGYLEGVVDAPFLSVTPGTRLGVVYDSAFAEMIEALAPLEEQLHTMILQQREAEEEEATRDTLRSLQKAFRNALVDLPEDEYDWFRVRGGEGRGERHGQRPTEVLTAGVQSDEPADLQGNRESQAADQKMFFEHSGPMHNARISPATCVVQVSKSRNLRAIPRDRAGRLVEDGVTFCWNIVEGEGTLEPADHEVTTFMASADPALVKVIVTLTQDDTVCEAEALVTVTDSLLPEKKESGAGRGLPGYTFQKAPGQLWRSRYDLEQNVIVVNNGHRDFVYASKNKSLKLRYVCRLFAKELVYHNFPGYGADQLLERMIELMLYTEEHLR